MIGSKVQVFTAENWDDEVVRSEQPVLVDFWAPWCGPCRAVAPIVEELAQEYEGKLKVGKLNVDENASISMQFGVMSIPTLIVFKRGQPVEVHIGYTTKRDLKTKIDRAL